jgi:ribosome-associated toxin RatA of RatAB toxin-antitoxin module
MVFYSHEPTTKRVGMRDAGAFVMSATRRYSTVALNLKHVLSFCLVTGLLLPTLNADAKTKDSVRYSVRTPNSSIEAGAARIKVKAPSSELASLITDFSHYDQFISKFEKVRVVGRTTNAVDVYMQVPILKGAAKIWAVVRFAPIQSRGSEQVLEGHMIKGNVERLDAKWRIIGLDDQNSELRLEMLIVPKMPVPSSLVTGEVAYAADKAVCDVRTAAEK